MVTVPARTLADKSEKKNIDVTTTSQVVAAQATAQVLLLNGCAQGTTALTRLGRRITMKSLYWMWDGSMAATSAGASPLRLLIVYDKQTNGAAPAATDILVADAIGYPNNLSNSRRFVTLFDELIECVGASGPSAWFRKGYKKLNLNVEFNTGSAGTVADITSGSVYALIYQNGNIITANPSGQFYTRVRFTDN